MGNNTSSYCIDEVQGVVAMPRDCDNLALCLIITIIIQMSFYFVACTCKFDKVTDFAGGSNFVVLAILTFGLSKAYNTRQILTTLLVILWGIRLAGYLLYRIIRTKTDKRFDNVRENPLKFLVFWIIQIIWVYIVSFTVMFINSPTAPRPGFDEIEPRDVTVIIGVLVAIFGLVFETISDHIKFRFRNNPNNSGKWCDTGPWKVSRHPNYFGEICFWWGIFIISTSILEGWKWIAIISPLFITTILIGGSGMPLVERNADKKYGRFVIVSALISIGTLSVHVMMTCFLSFIENLIIKVIRLQLALSFHLYHSCIEE
jgi:steroid 5-alpha reductase family enzyme